MVQVMSWTEFLLMLWNTRFDWEAQHFQFFEVFSGCGAASREWSMA